MINKLLGLISFTGFLILSCADGTISLSILGLFMMIVPGYIAVIIDSRKSKDKSHTRNNMNVKTRDKAA